jgi:hypothetical protein
MLTKIKSKATDVQTQTDGTEIWKVQITFPPLAVEKLVQYQKGKQWTKRCAVERVVRSMLGFILGV